MQTISAIVYTSGTGFTRRYAQMLSRAAAIPAYDLGNPASLPPGGAKILYLGWLRAGGIAGLSKARRRWQVQAVCAVGMAPEYPREKLAAQNHTGELPVFYLQGGYAPEKMRGINKAMMGFMTRQMTKHPPKDEAEAGIQKLFLQGGDFVSEANLAPVLSWVRGTGA